MTKGRSMPSPLDSLGDLLAPAVTRYGSGFLPLPVALFLHSLFVAHLFAPGARLHPWWLVSWTIVFVGAFGGGIATAAFMGINPLGFLTDNVQIPAFTAAWWLATYFPYRTWAWERTPLHVVCPAVSQAVRVATICGRGVLARELWPRSWFAPLVMGVLGGTGGKFASDLLLHLFHGPSAPGVDLELVRPSWTLRSAVCIFAAHHALAVAEWGPQWGGQAAVMALQGWAVSHALLVIAWPREAGPCPAWIRDPSAAAARALHAALLVPVPPGSALAVDFGTKQHKGADAAPRRAGPGLGRAGGATPPPSARRPSSAAARPAAARNSPSRRTKKDL